MGLCTNPEQACCSISAKHRPGHLLQHRVGALALLLGFSAAIVGLASEQAYAAEAAKCSAENAITGKCSINDFINNRISDPGGFAGAAVSNEGLNGVAQASGYSLEAIRQRRLQESRKTCPDGFERVGNQCRQRSGPAKANEPSGDMTLTRGIRPNAADAFPYARTVNEPTYAYWSTAFGDYERRRNLTPGAVEIATTGTPMFSPVNMQRTGTTIGGMFGADKTLRNLFSGGDGLLMGAIVGYLDSRLAFEGSRTTSAKARLEGPSLGGYLSYFNGGFAADLTVRADLLGLKEDISQRIPVISQFVDIPVEFSIDTLSGRMTSSAVGPGGSGPGGDIGVSPRPGPGSGSGRVEVIGFNSISSSVSGRMTDIVAAGNVGYRLAIPRTDAGWFEPTAGFMYVHVTYSNSVQTLGLTTGNALRLQGGARIGADLFWNNVRVTPSLTGLVYSDVSVSGFVVPTAQEAFPVAVVPSDQGKVRGEGIAGLNFDFGNGLTSFVQGQVRGGRDLIGAGGKGGLRYQW